MAKGKKARVKVKQSSSILGELFSENLKKHRKRMDLTQAALAARSGYSVAYISMLEVGRRSGTLETIEHIAAALNVKDPRVMFKS